jgi:hypothetical protein
MGGVTLDDIRIVDQPLVKDGGDVRLAGEAPFPRDSCSKW